MFLNGQFVKLEPLTGEHKETIRSLANDERIWEYTKGILVNDAYDEQFDRYFATALDLVNTGGQAFVISDTSTNDIIGMTRLYDAAPLDKRISIGYTWYIPAVWGNVHNKECKLLLLQYVFEEMHLTRVEFFVAHQNIRSQKAVEKIGGVKEGVLRRHGYRNDGSVRDNIVYSIIIDEWPEKKTLLKKLVNKG